MNTDGDAHSKRERGRRSEERFLALFRDSAKAPDWLDRIERAKTKGARGEDIDFFVFSKDGKKTPVNIKSSHAGKLGFVRKHGPDTVCIIVMEDDQDDDAMRTESVFSLERWRARKAP
ncbi:MAG: hypothetical protein HZA81_03745 [Candidatus Taylorbacteria bacterium]|nr:hypothetical protein [Candidatus Taylorbacteria bacterium]